MPTRFPTLRLTSLIILCLSCLVFHVSTAMDADEEIAFMFMAINVSAKSKAPEGASKVVIAKIAVSEAKVAMRGGSSPALADLANLQLAAAYESEGEIDKASVLYSQAIMGLDKNLGPKHEMTLKAREKFIQFLIGQENYERALKANDEIRAAYADEPEQMNKCDLFEASIRGQMKQYDEAERIYLRALKRLKEKKPVVPLELFPVQFGLGQVYYNSGQYAKADTTFQQAYAFAIQELPPGNPYLFFLRVSIAQNYNDMGQKTKALSWYQQAILDADDSESMASGIKTANDAIAALLAEGVQPENLETPRTELDSLLTSFKATFNDFPRAYGYASHAWMKSMDKDSTLFDDPLIYARDWYIYDWAIRQEPNGLIVASFKLNTKDVPQEDGFEDAQDDAYWAFEFAFRNDLWVSHRAEKKSEKSTINLFQRDFFTTSMQPQIQDIAIHLQQDPDYYRKLSLSRFEGLPKPPAYIALTGENGQGSGYIAEVDGQAHVVCTMHQFYNRTPKSMSDAKGVTYQVKDRLVSGDDIQILSLTEDSTASPTLKIDLQSAPQIGDRVYLLTDEEAIPLVIIDGPWFSASYKAISQEQHIAAGLSGSAIIDAETGQAIGVLIGADSPTDAQVFQFKLIGWLLRDYGKIIANAGSFSRDRESAIREFKSPTVGNSSLLVTNVKLKEDDKSAVAIIEPSNKFSTRLIAPTSDNASKSFGRSLAMDNDYLMIADYNEKIQGVATGVAYLYNADGTHLLHAFTSPAIQVNSRMGYIGRSLAVANHRAYVVSRAGKEERGQKQRSDMLHVFDCRSGEMLYEFKAPRGASSSWGDKVQANRQRFAILDAGSDFSRNEKQTLYIRDAATGKELWTLVPSSIGYVSNFAMSERWLLISFIKETAGFVHLYDAASGKLLHEFHPEIPDINYGRSVLIGPDESFVAVGHPDARLPGMQKGAAYIYPTGSDSEIKLGITEDPRNKAVGPFYNMNLQGGFIWTLDLEGRFFAFRISDFMK